MSLLCPFHFLPITTAMLHPSLLMYPFPPLLDVAA